LLDRKTGLIVDEHQTVEEDFDFTVDLLTAFFAKARVQSTLNKIFETEATGWEKWWQIELAMFLSDYEDVAEWDIEEVFLTDLRTTTTRDRMAIDICFRRKGYAKGHFVFLELKQDRDWKRCIANMLTDAEKFSTSHKRSETGLDVRSFFLVGVYPSEEKSVVHDFIEGAAAKRNVDWDFMETHFIPNTEYSFTVV
jgi:hypothetical protein